MAQRTVFNARVIGAVQRDSPKLKMFMLSVMWSDKSEVIVYRSFQDFRAFHRQLKNRFPHFNPLRRKDRLIPKFSGEARKTNMQQKGSKRSIKRMRFLENYCTQLLKCDESVTQSSEVSQFFTPKDHDLQPDFTKNSVFVTLSDDLPDGKAGGANGRQPIANVSHPFVTQTYCCVAPYETKDTKNRPFKTAVNEKLDVLIKDPAGWWLVENEEKRVAWFPAPYLELLDEEEGEDAMCSSGGCLYITVRSYSSQKPDEVSVNIGTVVEAIRKSDDGWWLIRSNGKAGYIPSMYLQPYNNPHAGLFSLQTKLHNSTLNLASMGPQTPLFSSISEEDEDYEVRGRLQKARSLDMLSESWTQRPQEPSDLRTRSSSDTSQELSLSSFSGSESSSSEEGLNRELAPKPGSRRESNFSNFSSLCSTTSSDSSLSQPPPVPMRPKTEEILNRCSTMTRKAALASQARLQEQPSAVHAR
ncbi:NADPH oxidase organizer 1b [Periophthalmus magnuspinnatus]|uniref:NADPH oxidase organizer 1b n=1 Tax=Periophthalmus magnuspinnatus TaxID=409849 RepID=UPI00145B2346|nr:NADPH oxidase organizer 1b [Periophthalmus magnuspinnatus]